MERATQSALSYHYKINWGILRLNRQFGFPVQVQAHFPERGDRQTLELLFVLTSWIPSLYPFFQSLTLRAGAGLPRFALLPATGRPMLEAATGMAREDSSRTRSPVFCCASRRSCRLRGAHGWKGKPSWALLAACPV
jgi:hypothetical protein